MAAQSSVWRVSVAVTDGPPPRLLVYDNIAEAPRRDITELEHLPSMCVHRFLFKGKGGNGGQHTVLQYDKLSHCVDSKKNAINQH